MKNLEKIVKRIWSEEEFKPALLVGGLLFYLPVINLLLLGYLSLYLKQMHQRKGLAPFSWSVGMEVLRETLRLLPHILIYLILPGLLLGLLTWALQGLMMALHLSFFAVTLAFLPVAVGVFVLIPLFFTALWRATRRGETQSALIVPEVIQLTLKKMNIWLLPTLLLYGWLALTWPLLGFGVFAGMLPYAALLYSLYEQSI